MQEVTDTKKGDEATDFPDLSPRPPIVYFGMLIYFDKAKMGGVYRETMARIALNIGGHCGEFPLSFAEMLASMTGIIITPL
jgi:hypothetical protein